MRSALILCLFQQAGDAAFFYQVYWVNTLLLVLAHVLSAKSTESKMLSGFLIAYYLYAFSIGIVNVNMHLRDSIDALLMIGLFVTTKKDIALIMSLLLIHKIVLDYEPKDISELAEFVGIMVIGSFAYELVKKQLKGIIRRMVYVLAMLALPFASHGQEMSMRVYTPCTTPQPITGTLTVVAASTTTLSDATPSGNWTSSNTTVATIGFASGIVNGLTIGTSTISYTTGIGCAASATYTVTGVSYASWSVTNRGGTCVLSNSNLTIKTNTGLGSGAYGMCIATIGRTSGKYYWEVRIDQLTGSNEQCGISNFIPGNTDANVCGQVAKSIGLRGGPWCITYDFGSLTTSGSCVASVAGDIIGFAFDITGGILSIYRNNSLLGSVSGIPVSTWYPACNATNNNNDGVTARFDPASMSYGSSFSATYTLGW